MLPRAYPRQLFLRTPTRGAVLGLALLAACPAMMVEAAAARLDVRVEAVQSEQGNVRVVLYDKAEGFRKEKHSRAAQSVPAAKGHVSAAFANLPAGRYAVIAYHDEDGNGKLNLRLGMFPSEGYGLSNNPKISGPPKFADAAFELPEPGAAISIRLEY